MHWCVVIMRALPVTERHRLVDGSWTDKDIMVEEPVSVFGPYATYSAAEKMADHFNKDFPGEDRDKLVDNAPDFIRQEEWDDHWAIIRSMNAIIW